MKTQNIIKKNINRVKNPSNPVIYFFTYIYRWTFYFIYKIYNSIFPEKKVIVIDPIKNYIDHHKNKLISSFSIENMNKNVEKIFYDKKQLLEILVHQNNELEKIWKTRILIEKSPRGNIIMYYDAYKQGFAYYSDTNGIPYNILNAVAMRYVINFQCRDFFMDNEYVDEQKESPLIKIYLEYEKNNEKKEESIKKKEDVLKKDDAPFAKLKNYKLNPIDITNKDNVTEIKKTEKEYNRNVFINLGKICNFNILQKPPKKSYLNGFQSKLLEGVESESNLQNEVMSYSKYKEFLKKKKAE
jgi:hypothetical protein